MDHFLLRDRDPKRFLVYEIRGLVAGQMQSTATGGRIYWIFAIVTSTARNSFSQVTMRRTRLVVCCLVILASRSISAQDKAASIRILGISLSGSLRGRVENWDWFSAPPAQSSYVYGAAILRLNLGQSSNRAEWQVEGAFPLLVNLPSNAVAPEPQGPLGYGGDYFLANGQRNIGTGVLRQAFVGLKNDSGRFKFRIGRFEFADGAEVVPPDPDLAGLKRDRINQRLVGTFNYALRSFDGAQFSYHRDRSDVTAIAARVVEGSFQLRALNEINVEFGYGAYTRYIPAPRAQSEARFFALYYQDGRGVLKSDNRPQTLLEADRSAIRLMTPGAHFISEVRAGPGTADFVLWGAGQFGRWGVQSHMAAEIAAEAGYRFPERMQPWMRVGYFRSTGDPNPEDTHHNTFFQVLSSPRAYARFPFYVLMNTEDLFVQFKAKPNNKLALRSELHSVRVSSAHDLWYDGGGAFQDGSFGYLGRPSGGKRKIGTSLDLSAEYALSESATVSLYGGVARGNAIPAFVFPSGANRPVVHLLSIEIVRRF